MFFGALAVLLFIVSHALADVYPNCRGWINHFCCCTRNGCWEVQRGELEQIDEDTWLVVATGEKAKRTGWSQDGSFIRCASQPDDEGNWLIGPQYKTRCLLPPQPSS
jgi:hypothetical protein